MNLYPLMFILAVATYVTCYLGYVEDNKNLKRIGFWNFIALILAALIQGIFG